MNETNFTTPLPLKKIKITDPFWKAEMEIVRSEVIPYQWSALNDDVEGAAPSYCMHNFKVAADRNDRKRREGDRFKAPEFSYRGFEIWPEDPKNPKDEFYGMAFQDSDFYKWVEAVAYSLTQYPDPELERKADEAIDIVCAAQEENGYLDTYYILNGMDKIFTNLKDFHELYCLGHLIEGAVAYHQATGKDKLLNCACRYADFVAERFGEEERKCKGYPGHEIAEMALAGLYEETGEDKYLELAKFFVDERGTRPYYFDVEDPKRVAAGKEKELRYQYNQAHKPVREQDEAVGHAVRAVYLYSGMTDVARITKDEALYQACEVLWENVTNKKMYITGAIGGIQDGEAFSFNYDLPNDLAYAETCAAIGLMFWARRMLEIRPDRKYADVMERALYNSVLSGMDLDGKAFFYVNPLEVLPEACHKDSRKFHVKPVRQKWFGCACCPPNLARLLSSIGRYAYGENEDTLFVHLYIGGSIRKQVGEEEILVSIDSDMPWNGNVRVTVKGKDVPFTLAFRIPEWCIGFEAPKLAGASIEEKDGYLYITRSWGEEESFTLEFPMETRQFMADANVREDIGKAAVMRGPIVYCLEEVDNGKDLHLVTIPADAKFTTEMFKIGDLDVVSLKTEGYRQKKQEANGLYRLLTARGEEVQQLRLIPYFTWANRGENEMTVWIRER